MIMRPLRLLVALAAVASIANAHAEYPDRPIHMIVPYPPGGPNDVLARLVGPKLTQAWNQQVVIENRSGAGGNVGTELAAKAPADGYTTALVGGPAYVVNPVIYSKVGYSLKDFAPVSLVAKTALMLVVHPSLPVADVKQLIALAKSKPGEIPYASGGSGTSLHLAAELFKLAAGVDMVHVPYKGTNDLIPDLLAGRVPVAFVNTLIAQQHVKAGRLKALGVTSTRRLAVWPEVPSVAEAGVPGFEMEAWYGILVPAGTPRDVVAKLSGQIAQALKAPDVQEKLATLGADPVSATPAETAAFIEADAIKWEKVVRAAKIKAD
jgi:tripartite-type tricarboxylate transporter receptor subunit TctC